MDICTDLSFKPLEAEDLINYNYFYGLRPNKTCDSVSLESYLWKDYYNVRASIATRDNRPAGLLWLMGDDKEPFAAMPLCKNSDLEFCFYTMVNYFNNVLKKPFKIYLADEEAIKVLDLPQDRFLVREEEDLKDYLYSGNALRTLSGKKLHKKKNNLNYFTKTYEGRYEYSTMCCSDRDEVFSFLDRWRIAKADDIEEHLEAEVNGIHSILKNCSILNIHMGCVRVDGVMEAFTIGSYNQFEDMVIVHIEKANPNIRGLYQYINREFLLREFPDAGLVNREDDMGLDNLRQAKLSYDPIGYARKYYVEQLDFKEG